MKKVEYNLTLKQEVIRWFIQYECPGCHHIEERWIIEEEDLIYDEWDWVCHNCELAYKLVPEIN